MFVLASCADLYKFRLDIVVNGVYLGVPSLIDNGGLRETLGLKMNAQK